MGEVPGQSGVFLVLEEAQGRVTLLEDKGAGYVKSEFYQVDVRSGSEEGLLGLAFHPDFMNNRKYYICYNPRDGKRRTVIQERTANAAFRQDAGTKKDILTISQPAGNHNGGTINFGADGFLYIGMGDGGGSGDRDNNAQNKKKMLGKMLRIDVNKEENGKKYAIPPSNPFVNDATTLDEIWVIGLRNPWKWSFDPLTNDLWVADVGQGSREEVTVIKSGENHGWRIMEGNNCFEPKSGCDQSNLTLPIIDYNRNDGTCITGGFVYRGDPSSPLYGAYIFGDYNSKRIWALPANSKTKVEIAKMPSSRLSSFAMDAKGQLYAIGLENGVILLLDHAALKPLKTNLNPVTKKNNLAFYRGANGGAFVFNLESYPNAGGVKLFSLDGGLIASYSQRDLVNHKAVSVKEGVYIARIYQDKGSVSQVIYMR